MIAGQLAFEFRAPNDNGGAGHRATAVDRVQALLAGRESTTRDLAAELGLGEGTVRWALKRLRAVSRRTAPHTTVWRLPSAATEGLDDLDEEKARREEAAARETWLAAIGASEARRPRCEGHGDRAPFTVADSDDAERRCFYCGRPIGESA